VKDEHSLSLLSSYIFPLSGRTHITMYQRFSESAPSFTFTYYASHNSLSFILSLVHWFLVVHNFFHSLFIEAGPLFIEAVFITILIRQNFREESLWTWGFRFATYDQSSLQQDGSISDNVKAASILVFRIFEEARTPTEPEGWNKMMKKPQRKKREGMEENLGREQGDLWKGKARK